MRNVRCSMFCFACVAAGCGRLSFDSEGAIDAGDAAVDGRQWQVVFDDTFDDGEIGTNVTGVGGGSHAEGASWGETAGAFNFFEFDGDYASSGMVVLRAFDGNTTSRRFEWDIVPGPAGTLNGFGHEYGIEAVVTALSTGNTNFNGEVYFNTTGSLNVQIGWSLESGNVIASGRLAATDATKPSACSYGCVGMADIGAFDAFDLGPVGSARLQITLELTPSGFSFAVDPSPTIIGSMSSTWAAAGVDVATALAPGVYAATFGGNDYIGRASSQLERLTVFELVTN